MPCATAAFLLPTFKKSIRTKKQLSEIFKPFPEEDLRSEHTSTLSLSPSHTHTRIHTHTHTHALIHAYGNKLSRSLIALAHFLQSIYTSISPEIPLRRPCGNPSLLTNNARCGPKSASSSFILKFTYVSNAQARCKGPEPTQALYKKLMTQGFQLLPTSLLC